MTFSEPRAKVILLKLEHIALCHQSAVNFLLQREGPCTTDNFLPSISPHSPIFRKSLCQLCSQSNSSAPALALHYTTVHYQDSVDT